MPFAPVPAARRGAALARAVAVVLVTVTCCLVAPLPAESAGEPTPAPGTARDLDRTAIERAWVGFREALERSDVASFVSLFTEDATLFQPTVDRIDGRSMIREFMADGFARAKITEMALETSELELHGDRAFELGAFRQTSAVKATGQERVVEGRYTAWWVEGEDGTWRIHRMMIQPRAPQ